MTRSQSRFAVAGLAIQSAVLGYNWVVMKIGLRYADTWSFAAFRFGFGALVLLIALALLHRPLRPYRWKATLILGLLQTTLASGLHFMTRCFTRLSILPGWASGAVCIN